MHPAPTPASGPGASSWGRGLHGRKADLPPASRCGGLLPGTGTRTALGACRRETKPSAASCGGCQPRHATAALGAPKADARDFPPRTNRSKWRGSFFMPPHITLARPAAIPACPRLEFCMPEGAPRKQRTAPAACPRLRIWGAPACVRRRPGFFLENSYLYDILHIDMSILVLI